MFWGGTDVPIEDSGEKASPVSLFFWGGGEGTDARWRKQGVNRSCQASPQRSSDVQDT